MRVLIIGAIWVSIAAGVSGCAHTSNNVYERSTTEQRAHFKKVMLPLPLETKFKISSGAFACCTHNLPGFEYAWDFDVPYATPVISVEDGSVIQVWEPNRGGGCDRRLNDSAHNIKIAAKDGTVAQYVHVQSKVRIGDIVKKGQVIAVTANNGFHCVPQLHFNIFQDREHIPEQGKAKTIPILFEGLPDGGVAHEGFEGRVPKGSI